MEKILKCAGVEKKYGRKTALNSVNLELEGGKIIGLLGPNGSGKTTLIKSIAGVLIPDRGDIAVCGNSVGIESKKIVSYLPERPYFSTALKVSETVDFFESFYDNFSREKAEKMLVELGIDMDAKIRSLSKGNREKVQLVLVMSRKASLYLLDEPMGGIDPATRDFIIRTILANYNEDATVIISTHLISDVENILDEVIFLKDGNIFLHQSVDDIRTKEKKSIDGLFREVFAC